MRVTLEISFSFKHEVDASGLALELPEGADVLSALREFVHRYPHLEPRLFTGSGAVQRYINALINGGNVAFKKGWRLYT